MILDNIFIEDEVLSSFFSMGTSVWGQKSYDQTIWGGREMIPLPL